MMEAVHVTGRPFSLPSPTSPSLAITRETNNNIINNNGTSSSSSLIPKKRPSKSHVPAACVNCQKAHLACDVARPCKRCVQSGREDTCFDVQHKKRGRPRRRDRQNISSRMSSSLNESIYSSPLSSTSSTSITGETKSISNGLLTPGLVRSSFSMTRPPGDHSDKDPVEKSMITVFLSMDVCCARVSDESLDMLGIYPHEFAHRSLYDFILPEHADRLARIHRCLLDNVNRHEKRMLPPTQRTTSECFSSTSPNILLNIANGSLTLKEPLGFKTPNGSHLILNSRFYLGGGLGSDLFVSSSLEDLYIVCLATLEGTPLSHTSILHQPPPPPPPPPPPITTTVTASSFSSSITSPIQHQQNRTIIIESPPTVPSTPTPTPTIGYRPYPSIFNTTTTTPTLNSATTTAPNPITSLLEHTSISPAVAALFDTATTVSTTPTTITAASTITSSNSSTRLEYMIPSQRTPSPFYPPTSPSCNILNNRDIDKSIIMQHQPVSSSSSDHPHHDESSMKSSPSPSITSTSQVLNSSITPSYSSLPTTPIISSHTSMAKEHDDASRKSRPIKTPRVKLPRPEDCLFAPTEEDDRQRRRNSKDHLEWNHPREMYLRKTTSSRLLSAQANSIMGNWFPYQSPSSAMVAAVRSATSHPSSSSSLNPVATHHRIPSINSRIPSHQRPFVQRR
ncbi:hypothetical protein INT45_004405 [Circinella minor]|uniref:Zn(2)-C6 fungal-type domain-containing protein n=1 Tax=Circinella minor TaxID=1195481 RepID=A0A8H7S848_9FUNG|nr:hypothetical protein INT45_004405 [Circinella minor]